ncbi:hypothetical protein BDY19DRAFT_997289 [Irpex rosettiformis]|uniref:Uncharacterized protein n=1 Tax=Irpex rosettiformis TaxID=378272 RepID=A0ACB8TS78_9APHY|nr:hypothetical protein BDY19DRAFT_997289 [Irpex rosettiformis]
MAKGGSRITPFLLSTKQPVDNNNDHDIDDPQRPPQSSNPARMSTSSIFPSLRKLETNSTERPQSAPRPSTSRLTRNPSAVGAPSSSSSSSSPYGTPIVTMKLAGPSFLDVTVKDGVTKQPLYILETIRDSTFVYRLDSQSNEAVKAATVQWPQRIPKRGNSGRTVQLHNGRWFDTEEFLKFGTLTNFLNRRFYLPHFPHPLKWKPGHNSTFHCITQGIKGPIAILEPAYLNAPPRLRVYQTLNEGEDPDRAQQDYNGVPVILLDYLLVTAFLMVTDSQEWLDRKANDSGHGRIAGSSNSTVKRWLAIIHNEPIPLSPTCDSPMTMNTTPDAWDFRINRISATSSSAAGSSSSDPMTPLTPATSTHSFANYRETEIPPVPPLPENARTRPATLDFLSQPSNLDVIRPYSAMGNGGTSSGEASPSAGPSSAPLDGSYPQSRPNTSHSSRPLPRPPVRANAPVPLPLPRPQTSSGALTLTPDPVQPGFYFPGPTSLSAPSLNLQVQQQAQATSAERPSTPSTSSSSGTAPRRSFGVRRSLTVANVPAAGPPPSTSLPLPPKLAEELNRQMSPPTRPLPDISDQMDEGSRAAGLQLMNPDPLAPEEEERLREQLRQLAVSNSNSNSFAQGSSSNPPGSSYVAWMAAPPMPTGGPMVDAGLINMPPSNHARRQSYAETVYEQPPPAYDAIDFSLHAPVHMPR